MITTHTCGDAFKKNSHCHSDKLLIAPQGSWTRNMTQIMLTSLKSDHPHTILITPPITPRFLDHPFIFGDHPKWPDIAPYLSNQPCSMFCVLGFEPVWKLGIWYRALDRVILKVGDLVSGHFGKLGIWIGPFLKLGIFMVKKSWGLRNFFSWSGIFNVNLCFLITQVLMWLKHHITWWGCPPQAKKKFNPK